MVDGGTAGDAADTAWVSVPVPAHLLEPVRIFLLQVGLRGSPQAWDLDAMSELLALLDEPARRMVTRVAESSIAGTPAIASALADRFGVSVREVFGIMQFANEIAGDGTRPDILWLSPAADAPSPAEREVRMIPPVATMVLAARDIDQPSPKPS